jgi:hypothetical protein
MTDFTGPDPKNADSDEEVEPEFAAEVTEDDGDAEMMIVDANASCLRCQHFEVCAIFSGIQPMMQDWHSENDEDDEPPIDVEKLAWHCREYLPKEEDDFVDQ